MPFPRKILHSCSWKLLHNCFKKNYLTFSVKLDSVRTMFTVTCYGVGRVTTHCPKCKQTFRDITWNVVENMILHEIFRVVSRFPRYISCYIAENRFPLGQCKKRIRIWNYTCKQIVKSGPVPSLGFSFGSSNPIFLLLIISTIFANSPRNWTFLSPYSTVNI